MSEGVHVKTFSGYFLFHGAHNWPKLTVCGRRVSLAPLQDAKAVVPNLCAAKFSKLKTTVLNLLYTTSHSLKYGREVFSWSTPQYL